MSKPHELEAVPTDCAIKIILKVVRPHTTMTYEPDIDVEVPIGLLKEELEEVLKVAKESQQWVHKGAELMDSDILAATVSHGEAEIIVNILPDSQ